MSELLPCVEQATGPRPAWSVVWLHGLGADGHDFAPIVPDLVRPGWPPLRFVFPHAPVRPVTVNGGVPMRAWYDIPGFEPGLRDRDTAGIAASVAQVEALVARERDRGVPASRVMLAGFSQGAAITLAAGLRRREPLAGLVALSGYLPQHDAAIAEATPAARQQPVFIGHGAQDPVVPQAMGERARDALKGLGMAVEWRSYRMPHSVCAEEIAHLGAWLQARFEA